jgi:hypothetical protein
LTTARDALHTLASEARAKVAAIKADKRISKRERTTQLAVASNATFGI